MKFNYSTGVKPKAHFNVNIFPSEIDIYSPLLKMCLTLFNERYQLTSTRKSISAKLFSVFPIILLYALFVCKSSSQKTVCQEIVVSIEIKDKSCNSSTFLCQFSDQAMRHCKKTGMQKRLWTSYWYYDALKEIFYYILKIFCSTEEHSLPFHPDTLHKNKSKSVMSHM